MNKTMRNIMIRFIVGFGALCVLFINIINGIILLDNIIGLILFGIAMIGFMGSMMFMICRFVNEAEEEYEKIEESI